MDLTTLGRTGLRVTRLGLGTAPLGGLFAPVDEAEAVRVVRRAYELGIRLFDTAPLYGFGRSERILGLGLRDRPRDSYVLATKVGRLLRESESAQAGSAYLFDGEPIFKDTPPGISPEFDFSAGGVLRSLEESLQRLGLDRADILHLHDPDDHVEEALHDAYKALDGMRREGVIRAVGAGMNGTDVLTVFAHRAAFDCFLLAGRYTLLDQSGIDELLPLCEEKGIAVIAGGVFNTGVLAAPSRGARYAYRVAPPDIMDRAWRVQDICLSHGVPLPAAAMRFPLGHPAVAAIVVGARSVRELEEDVELFHHPIPPGLWDDLRAAGLLAAGVPAPVTVPAS